MTTEQIEEYLNQVLLMKEELEKLHNDRPQVDKIKPLLGKGEFVASITLQFDTPDGRAIAGRVLMKDATTYDFDSNTSGKLVCDSLLKGVHDASLSAIETRIAALEAKLKLPIIPQIPEPSTPEE